jgi:hypothetical protein
MNLINQSSILFLQIYKGCCDPNFGFATKARACKGVGQKKNLKVIFHVPGNVGECNGMNMHTF